MGGKTKSGLPSRATGFLTYDSLILFEIFSFLIDDVTCIHVISTAGRLSSGILNAHPDGSWPDASNLEQMGKSPGKN